MRCAWCSSGACGGLVCCGRYFSRGGVGRGAYYGGLLSRKKIVGSKLHDKIHKIKADELLRKPMGGNMRLGGCVGRGRHRLKHACATEFRHSYNSCALCRLLVRRCSSRCCLALRSFCLLRIVIFGSEPPGKKGHSCCIVHIESEKQTKLLPLLSGFLVMFNPV